MPPAVVAGLRMWGRHGRRALTRAVRQEAAQMEDAGACHLAYSALEALRALGGSGRRGGALAAQQARVARRLGASDRALALYAAAARGAARHGDRALTARVRVGVGAVLLQRGQFAAARAAFVEALALASAASASAGSAHHGLLLTATATGNLDLAFAHGRAAYRATAADPMARADLLVTLGRLLHSTGRDRPALRAFAASLRLAAVPPRRGLVWRARALRAQALRGAVSAAACAGDELAAARYARALALAFPGRRSALPLAAHAWIDAAVAHLGRGDPHRATRALARARCATGAPADDACAVGAPATPRLAAACPDEARSRRASSPRPAETRRSRAVTARAPLRLC
ncbi:hypothetical protein [Roseisolibacter agri]|uniref:hypothetical protein n=1 Tax=Roseisolibacter agri TaxID=2014610 RepID=UPI0024E1133F|nr:hypothetical protein [Roseisolibacter agri]